jgi:hypothetical protein
MKKTLISAIAFVFLCALLGCAGDHAAAKGTVPPPKQLSPPQRSAPKAAKVPQADVEAVTSGVNDFLKAAGTGDYPAISAMIVSSQSTGFDAKKFIEDRFRMKLGEFEIAVWDLSRVGITPVKGSPDVLSSIVVAARIMAVNEARPVVVNLRWQKESGKWRIVPFPEAK